MRINRLVLCVWAVCFVGLVTGGVAHAWEPLDADALADSLDELIDSHPTAKRTTVTLKVVDLETGDVLYDRGGGKLLIPASNLKIYTAAAALDLLGPEYQWRTQVLTKGTIKRGVCSGDLLIHGTGDPMLDTGQLAALADELVKEHGLERVKGKVRVVTHPRWENVPLKGTGWMWDDDPYYFNMSIRSTMLNFNVLTVNVARTYDKFSAKLDPPTDWPPIRVELTRNGDAGVEVSREPFDETIHVVGNLRPEQKPVRETLTVHDPALWIAGVFEKMLEERGVTFAKTVESDKQDDTLLASQTGKTLAEALKHFLKVSENAVGEMVLLKLAETQTGEDVSWPVGARVITDWLVNTAGLEDGSFRIVDGSGLSRYNLISADSSVKLLAFMKTHKHFEPFFDGLPVYEVSLPEGDKWGGVPLAEFDAERVFAKTGGMSGVSTVSGYIKTLDGRWLAFSLLANGYIGSSAPVRDLRNAVWAELVRYQAEGARAQTP